MTIHQPSARLFNLIDNVIFLSAGKVVYNGPVSKLQGYINDMYIEAKLGSPPLANAPETFLDLVDILNDPKNDRIEILTRNYLENVETTTTFTPTAEGIDNYANSFFVEVFILSSRALKNVFRTPELFFARIGAAVGFGVQVGTLFLFPESTITGLQHKLSYFVFIIAFFLYTSLEALPIFLAEREIFQREFSRGAYRAASYTVASTIVYFPFLIVLGSLFTCITWWLLSLPNLADPFFFQCFIVFTILVAGQSFAVAISTLGDKYVLLYLQTKPDLIKIYMFSHK